MINVDFVKFEILRVAPPDVEEPAGMVQVQDLDQVSCQDAFLGTCSGYVPLGGGQPQGSLRTRWDTLVFLLEWEDEMMDGIFPDVTDVCLAAVCSSVMKMLNNLI